MSCRRRTSPLCSAPSSGNSFSSPVPRVVRCCVCVSPLPSSSSSPPLFSDSGFLILSFHGLPRTRSTSSLCELTGGNTPERRSGEREQAQLHRCSVVIPPFVLFLWRAIETAGVIFAQSPFQLSRVHQKKGKEHALAQAKAAKRPERKTTTGVAGGKQRRETSGFIFIVSVVSLLSSFDLLLPYFFPYQSHAPSFVCSLLIYFAQSLFCFTFSFSRPSFSPCASALT